MRVVTRVFSAVLAGALLVLAPAAASAAQPGDAASGQQGVVVGISDGLFFADHSAIPVEVTNTLPSSVTVRVLAWADSGRLNVSQTPITVTVPAQAQATVDIPATAVSNGQVIVSAALLNDDDSVMGRIDKATINVQAGWETPVALVIAALVAVIAVLGIVRTVSRIRKRRLGLLPADSDSDG